MIRLLGSRKTLCDGFTRRDLLHVGSVSCLGLGMDAWERRVAMASGGTGQAGGSGQTGGTHELPGFGRAKACILLFLFGSPPQHETFDPKPLAPAEIQGELKAIATNVPGVEIGEGLPRTARIMDRLTVVRSMTHPYPLHGVAYALTGMADYTPEIEAKPRDARHRPFLGSVVDYLSGQREAAAEMPRNIGMPWQFGSKSTLPTLAGPYASFLGSDHDPVWTDFTGTGTTVVPKLTDGQTEQVRDPFGGATAGSFRLASHCQLPPDIDRLRLDTRRLLLDQFNQTRRLVDEALPVKTLDRHQSRAWSLLMSARVREALDIQRESVATRETYGPTLFGQSCLAARRLVESGCRFVSVFWDPFGPFGGSVWDTHANHFPRLKEYLLPVFDQSFTALIGDLEQRGLLDETLVLCTSEHGRTPQIDSKPRGAARHHWSRAYSSVFAGGGIARGRVVGRSDAQGGDVADVPVSPKDMQATAYHLLGFDPRTQIHDSLGRPHPIAGDGRVRRELLS
jgi:hypothetical protein